MATAWKKTAGAKPAVLVFRGDATLLPAPARSKLVPTDKKYYWRRSTGRYTSGCVTAVLDGRAVFGCLPARVGGAVLRNRLNYH